MPVSLVIFFVFYPEHFQWLRSFYLAITSVLSHQSGVSPCHTQLYFAMTKSSTLTSPPQTVVSTSVRLFLILFMSASLGSHTSIFYVALKSKTKRGKVAS